MSMDNNNLIKVQKCGGAGNKSVYVAIGRLNGYFLHYMNYWDLCGGEVLVKAQGGMSV